MVEQEAPKANLGNRFRYTEVRGAIMKVLPIIIIMVMVLLPTATAIVSGIISTPTRFKKG